MANKTAARSGARTTRSHAPSRPVKPAPPRRKPPVKKGPSPLAVAAAAGGRAARATWLLVAVLFRMSSLAALISAVAAPLLALLPLPLMGLPASRPLLALSVATAGLIWLRHHENIARILKGTEPRIGAKKG